MRLTLSFPPHPTRPTPGVHPSRSGASGRAPTASPATPSSRTSCSTGSRPRSQAVARVELLVLAGHDVGGAVPAADSLRTAAALPLRSIGRARLPVGEGHRVRRDLRVVDPRRAPHRRPRHGRRRGAAPGAGVPDRRVQERRRRRASSASGTGSSAWSCCCSPCSCRSRATCCPGISWPSGRSPSAPTSPRPCRSSARGARVDDRWPHHRAGHPHPLLRAALVILPGAPGRALRVSHVARAQGRRPRAPPTARRCFPRPGTPRVAQDLHAARRRARHGPDDSDVRRSTRPTDRERGPGSRTPRHDRRARRPSPSSASWRAASRRRSKNPPTRS
jgi:hypothetical protein